MTSKDTSRSYPREIDTCSTASTQLTASDLSVTTGSVDADCKTKSNNVTDEESAIPPPVSDGLKRQDNFVGLRIPGAFAVSSHFTSPMTLCQENRNDRNRTAPHQGRNVDESNNIPTVNAELVVNTKIPQAKVSTAKEINSQHSQNLNHPAKTEDKSSCRKYLWLTIFVLLLISAILVAVTTIVLLNSNSNTKSFEQKNAMAANFVNCTMDPLDFQYNRTDHNHTGRSGRSGIDRSSRSSFDRSNRSRNHSHRSGKSDGRSRRNCRRRQHHSP